MARCVPVHPAREAHSACLTLLLFSILVPAVTLTATPLRAADDPAWIEPVEAPVVDPFRPPASRYGAGNRGLEYGTAGGEVIRAVAAGRVTYVGTIGSQRFVVIDHGNGLRSTYAFVESILVTRGRRVAAGDRVAIAGPGFHLTARLGDVYVDPELLFAGARAVPRLVPSGLSGPRLITR